MKFSQRFQEQKLQGWKDNYADYDGERKLLKQMKQLLDNDKVNEIPALKHTLFEELYRGVEMVSDFDALKMLEIRKEKREIQFKTRILFENSDNTTNLEFDKEKKHLINRLKNIKSTVKLVQNFRKLNQEAFRRIIKSYKKTFQSTEEMLEFEEFEAKQSYHGDEILVKLKQEVNKLLDQLKGLAPVKDIQYSDSNVDPLHDDLPAFAIIPGEDPIETLKRYKTILRQRAFHHFGYPYNLNIEHFDIEELSQLVQYSINNLGDPFVESNYGVHSRAFEVEVLKFFAKLWKIQDGAWWGYCTTCGTEGNLHGILVGREKLPTGTLIASRESHYSVFKAARFYRMKAMSVDTLYTGEMDYDQLEKVLIENKPNPAVLNVNVGTTVKGAIDNLDRILEILEKTGYTRDDYFIHCDGALEGLMLPFLKDAVEINFTKPVDSISVSGHKFMGCPMPSGIIIVRKEHIVRLSRDIAYLNSRDTTIMGSRNGQAPIFLWYTLQRKGMDGFAEDIKTCVNNAAFLYGRLRENGISAMLNDFSNTVVLERPDSEPFIRKWQLACEGNIAHVVVMQSVTKEKIILFVKELVQLRKITGLKSKCVKAHIGPCCICDECRQQSSEKQKK